MAWAWAGPEGVAGGLPRAGEAMQRGGRGPSAPIRIAFVDLGSNLPRSVREGRVAVSVEPLA
jgi:hypothetical protein